MYPEGRTLTFESGTASQNYNGLCHKYTYIFVAMRISFVRETLCNESDTCHI